MKNKKIFIGGSLAVVIAVIASLIYTITVFSNNAHIRVEYSITYEAGKTDEGKDYIVYNLVLSNESAKALINFDADISLDDQMKEFTQLLSFITEPMNLPAKDSKNLNRNKIIYSKKTAINKFSSMNKEQIEKLNNIYSNIKIDMSWIGGKREVSLSKNDLINGSILDLTEISN
ncbi:hypothetical protein FE784_33255 [Paenibacillus hemerocallicola]|jgi:hypothetical protein|uniref:Uncharacterized protein n=1 Tax=Paenibacillus hemerocallicola TaxID=1172614 RepID=A0A5C4SZD7_9BACL|nr:hypothetical protein [Paenibacillus hemerocallicola]TNJ61930.1 hypothetical protein FE784_33255 [Paenibacillus hemerocallicola]